MKIIVTGGAGFIASHIADLYIEKGHRVVVIDDLSRGSRKNLNSKAKFYKADIQDSKAIQKIFKAERPEAVNHHAAMIEVATSLIEPRSTLEVNVLGTTELLMAFGQYGRGARRFIMASTGGAIYGNPKKLPANEATPPMPLSPYAVSKILGEELLKFYARMHDFEFMALRYSNVFGPRQFSHGEAGVVAIFEELMRHKKQPTIFGDGSMTRDYVFVRDVARANLLALIKGKNDIVNIGTGKMTSVQEIYDVIAERLGYRGEPHYAPAREGEVQDISIDAKKAGRVLGWKPQYSFAAGIRETVK